jgi:hypothetical protein
MSLASNPSPPASSSSVDEVLRTFSTTGNLAITLVLLGTEQDSFPVFRLALVVALAPRFRRRVHPRQGFFSVKPVAQLSDSLGGTPTLYPFHK